MITVNVLTLTRYPLLTELAEPEPVGPEPPPVESWPVPP